MPLRAPRSAPTLPSSTRGPTCRTGSATRTSRPSCATCTPCLRTTAQTAGRGLAGGRGPVQRAVQRAGRFQINERAPTGHGRPVVEPMRTAAQSYGTEGQRFESSRARCKAPQSVAFHRRAVRRASNCVPSAGEPPSPRPTALLCPTGPRTSSSYSFTASSAERRRCTGSHTTRSPRSSATRSDRAATSKSLAH